MRQNAMMTTPSQSRKVLGYLKAYEKWRRSKDETERLHDDVMARHRTLNGGQLGEVQRILHVTGGKPVDIITSPPFAFIPGAES